MDTSPLDHTCLISVPVGSFSLEAPILRRLASIGSSSFLFLIPTHARPQRKVNPRGSLKTEAFGDFDKIELMHIKY